LLPFSVLFILSHIAADFNSFIYGAWIDGAEVFGYNEIVRKKKMQGVIKWIR
jgi:hypothetical protein